MADLLEGNDSVGGEDFCEDVYNLLKNHWRQADPIANLSGKTAGMIVSDSDDEKLYHITDESPAYDEILQATNSFDVIPYFLGVDLWSNSYHHIIRASEAEGMAGADLRVAVDESNRSMLLIDRGDIDTDFGLTQQANPTFYIFRADGTGYSRMNSAQWLMTHAFSLIGDASLSFYSQQGFVFQLTVNRAAGDAFTFNGVQLTDSNAEQAWMFLDPDINQTLTAGYVAVLVDVTETSLGDASAGAGYNALLDLRVATVTQFGIQNDGKIMTNQTVAATTPGNVTDKMPIYDGAGTLVGYIAIYDAIT